MDSLTAFTGVLGGVAAGAALFAVAHRPKNQYADWLGRECWVRPTSRPNWRRHVVVAVSWKGAVCVRDASRMDGDGYWIKKQSVPFRVLFYDPEVGGEDD